MRRVLWALVLSTLGLTAAATQASAAALLSKQVRAASAVDRCCTAGKLSSGSGYAQESVTMPSAGTVTARLTAAGGDWDLAVFEADSGQVVAGSAYRGSRELASGYAVAGERLVVQACRLSGGASTRRPERRVDGDRHDRRGARQARARLDAERRAAQPARRLSGST